MTPRFQPDSKPTENHLCVESFMIATHTSNISWKVFSKDIYFNDTWGSFSTFFPAQLYAMIKKNNKIQFSPLFIVFLMWGWF